jgi:hypothetical protein
MSHRWTAGQAQLPHRGRLLYSVARQRWGQWPWAQPPPARRLSRQRPSVQRPRGQRLTGRLTGRRLTGQRLTGQRPSLQRQLALGWEPHGEQALIQSLAEATPVEWLRVSRV